MSENINFEANLVAIAAALAAHGIHQVASSYSGSGDSGDSYEQHAYDAQGAEVALPDVEVMCERREYAQTASGYGYTVKPSAISLTSAISDANDQALQLSGHSGYENNEGGYGTLTIYASGFAELAHTDFVESDSDHTYLEFGPDSPFGESLAALAAVLKAHGCTAVQGEYTGSDDSGDGFDIYYVGLSDEETQVEINDEVTYLVVEQDYSNGKFGTVNSTRTADFEQALEDTCFAMVAANGLNGWEINEGGGGKLIVNADGTAVLDHYNNGENDCANDSTTWNDELRQEDDEAASEDQ